MAPCWVSRLQKCIWFGGLEDCVAVGRVQEQTHLHNVWLQTSREETFSSHASVEVVRDSRQTKVSKQIIFTSMEVSGCCLGPRDSSAHFLLFLIYTYMHVSFKPYFPADLTSGLYVHLCKRALTFGTQIKWPIGWRTRLVRRVENRLPLDTLVRTSPGKCRISPLTVHRVLSYTRLCCLKPAISWKSKLVHLMHEHERTVMSNPLAGGWRQHADPSLLRNVCQGFSQ